jgi:hypothetical protein
MSVISRQLLAKTEGKKIYNASYYGNAALLELLIMDATVADLFIAVNNQHFFVSEKNKQQQLSSIDKLLI